MPHKVIAAGHISLDITPVFEGEGPFHQLLSPGKLVQVGAAHIHTGGSAANTGLALKLLGAEVRLAGKVGADAFGGMVAEILRSHGAGDHLIVDPEGSTSYTVVLAPPGVDRSFLHYPGANETFASADVSDALLSDAALLHFGYPPLMPTMYAEDGRQLEELMRRAHSAGCATSLDMVAVDPNSPAAQVNWLRVLAKVLPHVDFFVPSIEELGFMLDRPLYEAWQEKAAGKEIPQILSLEEDIRPLARRCLALGAGVVLLKCGVRGMYWCAAEREVLQRTKTRVPLDTDLWAGKEGFEKSFVPRRVLSATGAGDTSIAAFLVAMLEGFPPQECCRLAAATGACCVEDYSPLGGLLPFPALRQRMAEGWPQQDGLE